MLLSGKLLAANLNLLDLILFHNFDSTLDWNKSLQIFKIPVKIEPNYKGKNVEEPNLRFVNDICSQLRK